jgi:hypothetical protein
MRKSLFGSIERLDARLKCSLCYDKLLVDKRNSVFVLLSFLMVVTVVPSAVGLVSRSRSPHVKIEGGWKRGF